MARKPPKKVPPPDPPPAPPPVNPTGKPEDEPLSLAEQQFVTEYLKHFKAGLAYRTVHPNVTRKSSFELGSQLLRKVNVRAEIRAELRELRSQAKLDAGRVLDQATKILFSDLADCYDQEGNPRKVWDIPPTTRAALQQHRSTTKRTTRGVGKSRLVVEECTTTFRLCSKSDALSKLFKYLGLETEIPPLDALLAALPRPLAQQIKKAMIEARRPQASSDNVSGTGSGQGEVGRGP